MRRIDAMETAFFETHIAHVQQEHPAVAPPAAMAICFMKPRESESARFHETTSRERRTDEVTLHRQLHYLQRLQHSRATREARAQSKQPKPVALISTALARLYTQGTALPTAAKARPRMGSSPSSASAPLFPGFSLSSD